MNARKGDVILSPGGTGLIGSLLRHVDPPQNYSHSGIMTRNYDEVTHSTASEDRLLDYKVGLVDGGDGIEPRVLKYMWPGVVTQSVEAAVAEVAEMFVDPENGKSYAISSFSPHAIGVSHNGTMEVVYPLVVKPDPFAETSSIRATLHAVASDARLLGGRPGVNSKSHYRLYCYTDPTIGQTTEAPAEAGWAEGTFPSVCSSFVWMVLKARGLHLESGTADVMPTDLESRDIDGGALVNPACPDGLYTYTAAERFAAAQWLFDTIHYEAFDEAGWLGELFTDAADDLANQVVNTFATDDSSGKDSTAWKVTKDANAVSPENILWWDAPSLKGYYGYFEPLIYREPRVEMYTVSRWKKVVAWGTISGTVTFDGAPVGGALVQVYEGKSAFTDGDGSYALTDVALGSYLVKAWKVIDGFLAEEAVPVTLQTEKLTVDIALQPPDERYRLAQISIDFWGKDEEWGDDEYTDPGAEYHERELGPDQVTNTLSRTCKWGGELRAEYSVSFALLVDNSVQVTVEGLLYEGTTEGTDDLDGAGSVTFNVPLDQTASAKLVITNTDENDDDRAEFTITVKNARNSN